MDGLPLWWEGGEIGFSGSAAARVGGSVSLLSAVCGGIFAAINSSRVFTLRVRISIWLLRFVSLSSQTFCSVQILHTAVLLGNKFLPNILRQEGHLTSLGVMISVGIGWKMCFCGEREVTGREEE